MAGSVVVPDFDITMMPNFRLRRYSLKLGHIVFANILTGEQNACLCGLVCGECVAQGFDNGLCTKV